MLPSTLEFLGKKKKKKHQLLAFYFFLLDLDGYVAGPFSICAKERELGITVVSGRDSFLNLLTALHSRAGTGRDFALGYPRPNYMHLRVPITIDLNENNMYCQYVCPLHTCAWEGYDTVKIFVLKCTKKVLQDAVAIYTSKSHSTLLHLLGIVFHLYIL